MPLSSNWHSQNLQGLSENEKELLFCAAQESHVGVMDAAIVKHCLNNQKSLHYTIEVKGK
jgi:hypothetical protein